jgi:hypothetical protein
MGRHVSTEVFPSPKNHLEVKHPEGNVEVANTKLFSSDHCAVV